MIFKNIFANPFLSTPSARRATSAHLRASSSSSDFYPRPPRGGRQIYPLDLTSYYQFLSTPSARRATPSTTVWCSWAFYFYPRPPRGGRPYNPAFGQAGRPISIHALREEGDEPFIVQITASSLFLSTPSARRATRPSWSKRWRSGYFYPRPPRGGRHLRQVPLRLLLQISIHALREEGDVRRWT